LAFHSSKKSCPNDDSWKSVMGIASQKLTISRYRREAVQATSENPRLCVTLFGGSKPRHYIFASVASLDFGVFGGCLQILSIRFTRPTSDLLTSAVSTSLRTRLRGFLVKMWRAWLCRRVILPVPVNLNRFAALFLVLFTIPPRYEVSAFHAIQAGLNKNVYYPLNDRICEELIA
jgi:hypothetical protein